MLPEAARPQILPAKGLNRVCLLIERHRCAIFTDEVRNGRIGDIEQDQHPLSIRIQESHTFQIFMVFGNKDPLGSGLDKPAEMANVAVGKLHIDLIGFGATHDGGIAEIAHMVGATLFVQDHIPVDEGVCACIEVADHIMGVHFRIGHLTGGGKTGIFHATFGKNQFLVGVESAHLLQRLEMVAGVPMEGNTVDGLLSPFHTEAFRSSLCRMMSLL